VCPDDAVRHEVETLLAHQGSIMGMPSSVGGKVLKSRYQILALIGHGGMGLVYKSLDIRLGRPVAVKVLSPWIISDPRARKRFLREGKLASALNHPNIVTVLDIDRDGEVDFIVMEYVVGRTLASLTLAEGLPIEAARWYGIQIAEALAAAHAASILHGDIKPPNIMVNDQDRVKLLDFGLARALAPEQGDVAKSDLFGTTAYMAPERQGARLTDPRSEIFSFGLILHQILSGEHPFGTGTPDEISAAIRTEQQKPLPPKVPDWFVDIVRQCLEKSAEDRFQSMQDVLIALQQSDKGDDFSAPPTAPPFIRSEVEKVRVIAGRITYSNVAESRQALTELGDFLVRAISQQAREAAVSALTEVILTLDLDRSGVPGTVRRVRKHTLEVLKSGTAGDLGSCFKDSALEDLDLFGMDFAGAHLAGTSFERCFLAEASFRGSNLAGASFAGAFVRNVDFGEADLSTADFTDIDWFNALGLNESQLACVRMDTLRACPLDIEAMHDLLEVRYGFPFKSWPDQVQEQLKATWTEYLRPGGLRDIVAGWRSR
jgi:serine/threonine protein kinase